MYHIILYIIVSVIAVYIAYNLFDYARAQMSVKRRTNIVDIYTKKYQDIIRDHTAVPPTPVSAPAASPPPEIYKDTFISPDTQTAMYHDLTEFALTQKIDELI